jgi:N-formylmaleamate deformylase
MAVHPIFRAPPLRASILTAKEEKMKNAHSFNRMFDRCIGFAALALFAASPATMAAPKNAAHVATRSSLAVTSSSASEPSFTVKITGHGQPMILIPGLASSGDTWNGTVAHFKNRYTCYVLTLAGFAGVPAIQRPLLLTVREDLAAYIVKHHLDKPVIVGHSLGANVALDLAEHHPELVGPVVIVDSLPFYAGAWFQAKTLADAQPIIKQMSAGMAQETQQQYLMYAKSGAATKYMVTSPENLQELEQWSVDSDMHTVNNSMIELVSEDLRPDLSRITSPTLVLGTWIGVRAQLAERHISVSRAETVSTFEQQYENLPHLHFAMSDQARHFIMFDDPQWFYAQLDKFLANPLGETADRGFGGAAQTAKSAM